MKISVMRGFAAGAGLILLAGCETTSTTTADLLKTDTTATVTPAKVHTAALESPASATAAVAPASETPAPAETASKETTGTIPPIETNQQANADPDGKALLGGDPNDDLSLAKGFFRDGNYGLAERYFRRAAEAGPRDAEAWLGLAASYDRLKRFNLADRAYGQVLRLAGPTPEVLNNIGYSYMLRGDYRRARQKLAEAQVKDPDNPYVRANLQLLEESRADRKAIR
ncbi:MAG: tetratricopeptide repeat protein [Xanthobacteraceae bacterium]